VVRAAIPKKVFGKNLKSIPVAMIRSVFMHITP